ncbi:MAG: malonic semialdehyde reductase [Alphaproteobacteria bacterium]|jgi:3-hydroxypropanoate dehydrogenase|nr:malonic semialdehyde reductase [Alphaproteobacteria bacterium]
MINSIDQAAIDQLFLNARTHSFWQDKEVSDDLLKQVYDLAKICPTSANCSPLRVIFVKSTSAKEKLRPLLAEGNIEKTMSAPVTAILGHDMEFYEKLPILFPHADAKSWFTGSPELVETTAFRNGTLQGAYFILAARSLGLDCGPMSGFDNKGVDQSFFAGTSFRSNFLCNLGYGIPEKLFPRSPRLNFTEACQIL